MKDLIKLFGTMLLLNLCFKSYSQTSIYAGVWKNGSKARPYAYVETGETQGIGFSYSPVLGIGYNSVNRLSGTIGFDTKLGYGEVQPILGFGVELLGWDKVYQDYMPNFRAGFRYKRVRVLSSVNWGFEDVDTKWGTVKKPSSKLTCGLFVDLK